MRGPREIPGWAEVLPEGAFVDDSHPGHYEPQRRIMLPLVLFIATCFSTFLVGISESDAIRALANPSLLAEHFRDNWRYGLTYSVAVMSILLAHEMGHFLQAVRYRVNASLPFFIPMPFSPIGTMGAVIGMQGSQANRKELFDIGLSGPLAGLVLAIPMAVFGVLNAKIVPPTPGEMVFHSPLAMQYLVQWLRPDLANHVFDSPLIGAAWVGFLITGLNMIPISQLDGGHVSYALFGRGAWFLARLVIFAAMGYMLFSGNYQWIIMLLLVMVIGVEHPPTRNDHVPIGPWRYALGLASLLIPIFCMAPIPISNL